MSFINFNELTVYLLKDFSHLHTGPWSQALIPASALRVPTVMVQGQERAAGESGALWRMDQWQSGSTNLNTFLKRKLSCEPHRNLDLLSPQVCWSNVGFGSLWNRASTLQSCDAKSAPQNSGFGNTGVGNTQRLKTYYSSRTQRPVQGTCPLCPMCTLVPLSHKCILGALFMI